MPPPEVSTVSETTRAPRDPLAPFYEGDNGILETIIRPRINTAYKTYGKPINSEEDLHLAFKDVTGSCVSKDKFKEWLSTLNIAIEPSINIRGLEQPA